MLEVNDKLKEILDAVTKYPTLTQVAKACYVSQPYVSRLLTETEANFGTNLVNRKTTPISLTYAGTRVLIYLQEQDLISRKMASEIKRLSQHDGGMLTIAVYPGFANYWMPILIPKIQQRFPALHIKVVEVTTSVAERQLPSGKIDVFIGKVIYNEKITSLNLGQIPLYLVIPKNSSLFDQHSLYRSVTTEDIRALNGAPFITISPESRFQEMIDHFLQDNGVRVRNVAEVQNTTLATILAAAGDGYTITMQQVIENLLNLQNVNALELPINQFSLDLAVSYSKSNSVSTFISQTVEIIQKIGLEGLGCYQRLH